MRCLALCLAIASLAAADPVPAAFIPADADVAVQVPDLGRSQVRWQRTPYPRLLESGWGRLLVGEWSGRLERIAPGAGAAITGLQSIAFAVQAAPEQPPRFLVAAAGAQLPQLLAGLWRDELPGLPGTRSVEGGRLTTHGQVVAWANGAGGAVQPGVAPAGPGAEADAGVRLVAGRWLPAAQGEVLIDFQLDAVGLRETAVVAPTAASRLAATAAQVWADPQELRRLPASTLWAATWQGDPQLAAGLPGQDAAGSAMLERWLADTGLPGWQETVAACAGPATVWMAEGVPFPTINAALTMREEVARRWIAAATAKLNLAATPEGASGFAGLLPVALGWVPPGRLVITTDPLGVTAWQKAKPGFAEQRGVAEVLAAVPPRTLLLGAGRGGASWAALAQLTIPLFTAMGAPQSVSLPGDLRAAADRGWLYLRLLEDGTVRSEAGGLFGGPFTTLSAAGIAVPATMWLRNEMQREQRQRRQQRLQEADPGTVPPAPVF